MKNIIKILIIIFLILQAFQIDKVNQPVNKGMDFLEIKKTPEHIAQNIRTSCYDCHSNETQYPWYSYIQPLGWFLQDHIKNGRKKLNFSTFATYEPKRQAHKLYESWEYVDQGKMPLESYLLIHTDAKLTPEHRKEMAQYFKRMEDETRAYHQLPSEGVQ